MFTVEGLAEENSGDYTEVTARGQTRPIQPSWFYVSEKSVKRAADREWKKLKTAPP